MSEEVRKNESTVKQFKEFFESSVWRDIHYYFGDQFNELADLVLAYGKSLDGSQRLLKGEEAAFARGLMAKTRELMSLDQIIMDNLQEEKELKESEDDSKD